MKRLLLVLSLATLVVIAACGSGEDPTVQSGSSGSGARHNEADVEFAQGMIPHHAQAVEMAEMALETSESDAVKDLAVRIKDAQGPEIEKMKGWLADWGEPLEAGGGPHGGMNMEGDSAGGDGMMSDDDMKKMSSASGTAFDRMFLEGMIVHHNGAVAMAEAELADGEYPEARALAQDIIDAQEAEIAEMEALLDDGATTTTAP